jgi:hypothetical protein
LRPPSPAASPARCRRPRRWDADQAHAQADPAPVDDPRQEIAPELIGAEEMLGRRRAQALADRHTVGVHRVERGPEGGDRQQQEGDRPADRPDQSRVARASTTTGRAPRLTHWAFLALRDLIDGLSARGLTRKPPAGRATRSADRPRR